MSDTAIKAIFDEATADLVIDNGLVSRIHQYRHSFVNRNDDHVSFFGGHYLGVEVVRHTRADRDTFLDGVMGLDEHDLKAKLLKIPNPKYPKSDKNPFLIDVSYKRLSDPYNHAAIYLVHRILTSTKLSARAKEQASVDVVFMLQTKLLTSILQHYFEFPANPELAKATYAALDYKSSLKVAGSWDAWLRARAVSLISSDSIHIGAFKTFTKDLDVMYAITEPQDRLREVIKKMYRVFEEVRRSGGRIRSTTSTIEIDGELIVRSKMADSKLYISYIKSVIPDKNTFIRDEVLSVVTDAVHTVSPKLFLELLVDVSENYGKRQSRHVDKMVEELIIHAIEYIADNKLTLRRATDIGFLVTKLKALYMAPLMKDVGLNEAKEAANTIVTKARLSKSNPMNSSLRTALELYIVLRTLTMNYYR